MNNSCWFSMMIICILPFQTLGQKVCSGSKLERNHDTLCRLSSGGYFNSHEFTFEPNSIIICHCTYCQDFKETFKCSGNGEWLKLEDADCSQCREGMCKMNVRDFECKDAPLNSFQNINTEIKCRCKHNCFQYLLTCTQGGGWENSFYGESTILPSFQALSHHHYNCNNNPITFFAGTATVEFHQNQIKVEHTNGQSRNYQCVNSTLTQQSHTHTNNYQGTELKQTSSKNLPSILFNKKKINALTTKVSINIFSTKYFSNNQGVKFMKTPVENEQQNLTSTPSSFDFEKITVPTVSEFSTYKNFEESDGGFEYSSLTIGLSIGIVCTILITSLVAFYLCNTKNGCGKRNTIIVDEKKIMRNPATV